MYVKSLSLKNFRNYEALSLEFDPGINVFYGDNAQGKTNILEAVYLAGTTKSHRGTRDRDLIRVGEEESHLRMILDRRGNDYRIDVHLKKNRPKGVAVNGLPVRRAAELYEITSFIFFSPEDLNVIKNGPAGRRKFLDSIISGADKIYLSDLSAYNRILSQRNALLHEAAVDGKRIDELDIWDIQLVTVGRRIIEKRKDFLKMFEAISAGKHKDLTNGEEELQLLYEPNIQPGDLEKKTRLNRDYDLRTRETHAGPHRDDVSILANGMDLRVYGSQGQQRTAALSMKMAEIQVVEKMRGEMPILLLDDVLSELDTKRQTALLGGIHHTQTLVTCTGLDDFVSTSFHTDRIYHVEGGKA